MDGQPNGIPFGTQQNTPNPFTVEIENEGGPLGFTIASSNSNPSDPIVISEVTEGGLAARTEVINLGDILLAVNGQPTDGKSLSEIMNMVKSAGDILALKLSRPYKENNQSVANTYTVKLEKEGESLGLAITGKEDNSGIAVISDLIPGGLASRSGVIDIGDRVLAINGQPTVGKTLSEVTACMREAGDTLEMELGKERRPTNKQEESDTRLVELKKQGGPLGLSVAGKESEPGNIIISEVEKDGVAERSGVQVGDRVLSVNGQSTSGKSISEAITMLKEAGDTVELEIVKPDVANKQEESNTRLVKLKKQGGPLGLSVAGKESESGNIIISEVEKDGVAERSGVQVGDRVLSVNGQSTSGKSISEAITMLKEAGDTVELEIVKPDVAKEQDENIIRFIELNKQGGALGLSVAGKESEPGTIMISEVEKGGLAERSGIQVGDRVLAVNGQSTSGTSISQAVTMLKEAGDTVKLQIAKPAFGKAQLDGWMARPVLLPGCPPGLEYLTYIDQLLIQQQVRVLEVFTNIEQNNKYKIKNSLGQQVYFAKEDTDYCTRQYCGSIRNFVIRVYDNAGYEVMQVTRDLNICAGCGACALCDSCLSDVVVYAPPGRVVGFVRQHSCFGYTAENLLYVLNRKVCMEPNFTLEDGNNDTIFRIKGPPLPMPMNCCIPDFEFQVLNENEETVGNIRKQWRGMVQEMFTDADNFGITFPIDLNVRVKAVMLGAAFLIDFMYFESNR